jgi:RND family efflux transporter MFP subunit
MTQITSPVTGLVSRRSVEPGAQVAEGAPLLSVSQGETLKLLAQMKSIDTEKIRPGTPTQVVVDTMPDKMFRGKVTQVHELANFSGDESSVEIEMGKPHSSLKTGMPASASFPVGEQRDGIFLPKGALIQTQGREGHLFILENGKARRRIVICGDEQDSQIEVVSGLEPGELVVVTGIERLRDGSRVLAVE